MSRHRISRKPSNSNNVLDTAPMPLFKFEIGDSTRGPIGLVARIKAETQQEALRILRGRLTNHWGEDSIAVPYDHDGDNDDSIRVYFKPSEITSYDITEVDYEPVAQGDALPKGWESVETSVDDTAANMPANNVHNSFTFDQVKFVADMILAGAFDRIESMLPPNLPLHEYNKHRKGIHSAIDHIKDTAGMTVAIFLAQTTGEGYGVFDWDGAGELLYTIDTLVRDRTHHDYKGYQSGEKCTPDTSPITDMIAAEWARNR